MGFSSRRFATNCFQRQIKGYLIVASCSENASGVQGGLRYEELIQKTAQVWAACDVPVLEFLVPLNDMKVHVGRMVQVEVAEVVAAE